ncbi:MAG: polysaccharide deacetylase family protein [Flavobacteriales bacterium]|jgi:hypothetical protein
MLIFADNITPRLKYAVQQGLEGYQGVIQYTSDFEELKSFDGPAIAYTKTLIEKGSYLHIYPAGILDFGDFHRVKVSTGRWRDVPAIFVSTEGIKFDFFSAVFFLLTRYEEYWKFQGDDMGRYTPDLSVLNSLDILERPIVDEWRWAFRDELKSRWPSISFEKRKSNYISTIDVDSAFAYLHKGTYRTVGGFLKDVLKFQFKNLTQRTRVLLSLQSDPYDTYDYILEAHKRWNVSSIFFFLLADFGQFDKGLPHRSKGLQELIKRISKQSALGIHPGVASHRRYNTMLREKSRLETIIGKPIKNSRQHYLMLKFRTTYRLLKATGIEHDYTMGYAHHTGFRAGTARPYLWFDLKKNECSNLMIHPFVAMDSTLRKYMKLTPEAAIEKLEVLISQIEKYEGDFISLWHNETLTESGDWKGWRKVFEYCLERGSKI